MHASSIYFSIRDTCPSQLIQNWDKTIQYKEFPIAASLYTLFVLFGNLVVLFVWTMAKIGDHKQANIEPAKIILLARMRRCNTDLREQISLAFSETLAAMTFKSASR